MGFLASLVDHFTRPAWAGFFQAGQYGAFIKAVQAELARRGLSYPVNGPAGVVVLPPDPPEREPGYWGLTNLAQNCAQIPESEWPALIREHFDRMERIGSRGEYLDSLAANWEEARTLLKVRIYPADLAHLEATVSHEPAPGLRAVLVYDFPDSTATVYPDHTSGWKIPENDLFRIALQNVEAEEEPEATPFDLPGGAKIQVLHGPSFFAASRILSLERYVSTDSPFGALVGVPTRHSLLYYPIQGLEVVPVIQAFLPLLDRLCDEGPGSITNQLYWWRYGHLNHLPSRIEGRQIHFSPPESFVSECLNRLKEPETS